MIVAGPRSDRVASQWCGSHSFLEYDRNKGEGRYNGCMQLPAGAEELARVEVVRQ